MIELIIKSEQQMKRRAFFLFIIFILGFGVLVFNLTKIVVFEGKNYKLAVFQNLDNKGNGISLNYKRGQITDRNGIVLADSTTTYLFFWDPEILIEEGEVTKKETLDYIHNHFNISYDELYETLKSKPNSNYEIIGKEFSYSEIKEVKAAVDGYQIIGLHYREGYERVYPTPTIAPDIVGFVDFEMNGLYGIEQYYDSYLKGEKGRLYETIEDENRLEKNEIEAVDGSNVMLTIDYTVQRYINEAIEHYLEDDVAERIQVIVMDPDNGEILGMTDYPSFSVADPYDVSNIISEEAFTALSIEEQSDVYSALWKNQILSNGYEPGSTFKPFVYAAALEENRSKLTDTYTCYGATQVADRRITCWKEAGHGEQTMMEGLQNSCNIAFLEIGAKLESDLFYKYQHMFGFGTLTGIDLGGEVSVRSLIHKQENLGPVQLATSSFGQTFGITPIQLITGFSSIINGGYLYEPHVMKKVYTDEQVVITGEPHITRQVISEEVSRLTTDALAGVVNEGTGGRAKIAGYEIGGKTGTAEKLPRGSDDYIVSFIGFAPIEDPEVITLVVVDEPRGEDINSRFAATIFVDVMEDVMPYLHIFKNEENEENEANTLED